MGNQYYTYPPDEIWVMACNWADAIDPQEVGEYKTIMVLYAEAMLKLGIKLT